MRTRDEIESACVEGSSKDRLSLEVLLDCRALLEKLAKLYQKEHKKKKK